MKKALSKPLVITGLLFQLIGIVWGIVAAWQGDTLKNFFGATNWPIFLGFVLLIVAVLQARTEKTADPGQPKPTQPPFDGQQ